MSRLLESNFMPHGHCYRWEPGILWLHAGSDAAIALAYYTIPFFLVYIVRKRRDLAFPWVFVMFGAFILLCGTTHVLEIWSIWNGTYRLTGAVKAVTGIVSIATAAALVPVVPRVLSLVGPEQLRQANDALVREVEARREAERALRELNRDLERRVEERTADLARANADLRRQIAERETAEGRLRELNRTLERRVEERTADLEDRNAELQNFAYVAAHDLREPLRKIRAFGEMLGEGAGARLAEEEHHFLDRMLSAAARMDGLLSDLLAYSRVATQTDAFTPVPLGTVVGDVLADYEVVIRETDAEVTVDAHATVEGDARQLRQLVTNLVGNAFKYRRPDVAPRLRITAVRTPETNGTRPGIVRLVVEDNGIGFEERYREKIFEPFQRLHGRNAYEGTGMGLAICRRIVQRHRGIIRAESTPGEGSRFVVELPEQQPVEEA